MAVDSDSPSESPGPDTGIAGGSSSSQCDPSNNPSTSDTGIAGGRVVVSVIHPTILQRRIQELLVVVSV